MKLHELKPTEGSRHRRRRVGRGDSSGWGHTCGRGHKGQKARSGCSLRPFFEGGQITLFRRLPKRGFKSPDHIRYNVVNICLLDASFEAGTVVDSALLQQNGFIQENELTLKILGNGELSKALTVKAAQFSASARSKIEAAGGTCVTE